MAQPTLLTLYTVVLDPAKRIYEAGDELSGHIFTNFQDKVSVTKMFIACKGEETSRGKLIGDGRPGLVPLQLMLNSPVLDLREEIHLAGTTLTAGEHIFPFKFKLPLTIPSSWQALVKLSKNDGLSITYYLEASIEGVLEGATFKTKVPFLVKEKVPPDYENILRNLEPGYLAPRFVERKYEAFIKRMVSSGCFKDPKLLAVTATIRQNVYTAGEDISVHLKIRNDSKEKFIVLYGINRNYGFVREGVSDNETVVADLLPGVLAGVMINEKGKNLSDETTIVMKTNPSDFMRQPSLANSQETKVKDSIFLRLATMKGRRSKIVDEVYLPIYISSPGFHNVDHNGIDVDFQGSRGNILSYMLPYIGNVKVNLANAQKEVNPHLLAALGLNPI